MPCLQIAQFDEPNMIGSEDCLWLNVYTSAEKLTSEKLKPVLVWIYGGRFLVGSASSKVYSPHFMMDHNLVMVSIQWRVGPYGFLSTEDSAAPGNYGFQDQVLALQWIQANIHKFGGDPKQVTVSGHSAGSASAHLHTISPLSQGLLSQAISLSGTAANFWAGRAKGSHAKYAQQMGQLFDCPIHESKALIDCLRQVDPMKLTQAQWKLHDFFHASPAKLPLSTFIPRTDAEAEHPFMPVSPLELLRNGSSKIPWMTGITSQEGAWYTSSLYGQDSMEYLKEYQTKRVEATKSLLAGMLEKDEDIEKLLEFYTQNRPVDDQALRVPMSELVSDVIFNVEGLLAIHLVSKVAPVYFYQFNFRGNWSFAHEFEETQHDYQGVAHLDDISYYMRIPLHSKLSEPEVEIMKIFTTFIANFVKFGKPSDNWPAFKPNQGVSMLIENPPKLSHQIPFKSRMKFLMDLLGHPEDLFQDYQVHDEL